MRAYKVFNPDWTCNGFKYMVGKTYTTKEKPELCKVGFHACEKAINCFKYYDFNPKNKVAEVELLGDIVGDGDKKACNKIKLIREIKWQEVLELVNSGDGNSGNGNSGNRNSGNWNSGNRNSGSVNSGNRNSGNWNSGNWNSGNWNSGNGNSGNWNSGDWNSGMFNTDEPKARIFNKQSKYTLTEMLEKNMIPSMDGFYLAEWVDERDMTEKEKVDNPKFHTTCGYLKTYTYKEAWKNYWDKLSDNEKNKYKKLPNFNSEIFEEITGITV
jgi:hypothetical protein